MDIEERNRHLEEELSKAYERIERLETMNLKLEEENQRLKEENKRIKEELQKLRLALFGLKPSKKSKQDPDADDTSSTFKGKKLGPPFGHEGTSRPKPTNVDRKVVLKLKSCPHCESTNIKRLKPRYRYKEDIAPVRLFVTEYEIGQYYCPTCDRIVYPDVPEVINSCRFGIMFLLYITYLHYVLNLPYNKMAKLLNDTYEAGVSEGTLVKYIKRAAELFGAEYERIKRQMREFENCHYDDTGQRIEGENRWLWVFINKEAALYYTSKSRSKKVVVEILGEDYGGVTVQDFYPSYDGAPGIKQKDWAHLIKDARELAEKKEPPPGAKELYEGLQKVYHDAKEAAEHLSTEEERKMAYRSFAKKLKLLARANKNYRHQDVKRLAKRALKYRHEMFTFLLVPGVQPTNNSAERALRQCVVQRKISGCHRTEEGAMNRDVVMSVMETMKLQEKDFFEAGKEYLLNVMA